MPKLVSSKYLVICFLGVGTFPKKMPKRGGSKNPIWGQRCLKNYLNICFSPFVFLQTFGPAIGCLPLFLLFLSHFLSLYLYLYLSISLSLSLSLSLPIFILSLPHFHSWIFSPLSFSHCFLNLLEAGRRRKANGVG